MMHALIARECTSALMVKSWLLRGGCAVIVGTAALTVVVGCESTPGNGAAIGGAMDSAGLAEPPDMEAMAALFEAYATPGPYHQRLANRVGEWAFTGTFVMDPDAPPETSTGTSRIESIWDGRYLIEHLESEWMGQPFFGMAVIGYDNIKKQYVSIWIDSMSTGITLSESVNIHADGTTIEYLGEAPDPIAGTYKTMRTVERVIDDNTINVKMYDHTPDGREFVTMDITYKRRE